MSYQTKVYDIKWLSRMVISLESISRDRIFHFLRQVDRRLRNNQAIYHLAHGFTGLVLLLLLIKLTGVWDVPLVRWLLLGFYTVSIASFVTWLYLRGHDLWRSAFLVDRIGDLKDSVKSAFVFLMEEKKSDWMMLHISRSAKTVDELSPVDMIPLSVPRYFYFSAGVSFCLLTLFVWNPNFIQGFETTGFLNLFQGQESRQAEEKAENTEDTPFDDEGKPEELLEDRDKLRQRELELSDRLQELSEAQELLAASRAEFEELEADLQELAAQLQSKPGLAELSDVLSPNTDSEAAEMLRELAERLSDLTTSEALQDLLESLQNSNIQNQELADIMENLENSAGDLTPEDLTAMAETLEAMAQQMDSMGQQLASQQEMGDMGQGQQELQSALSQQQAGQEQQMGQEQSSGQAMQSQAGMMSSQMQMAQMQGDPSNAVPVDAGPAGDTTGPGGGGEEPVLGEATTLDVQLEMEILKPDEDKELVPEEIFERLSREEKSILNYEDVGLRKNYAEEEAIQRQGIPWRYRALVKHYFLSILNDTKTAPEP